MLKHNPKLKRAWNKAKKIENGDIVTLDMRFNSSKEFLDKFGDHIQDSIKDVKQKDLEIIARAL